MIEIHGSTGGTQRLFSVKYLFGEAKISSNFLELGDGERNQKNAFVKFQCASKIFGKIILKTLYFGKDHRTDSNVIAPLRMHF